MFRISEVNVSEMTFRISFRISEMLFGYVMTLRLSETTVYLVHQIFLCLRTMLKLVSCITSLYDTCVVDVRILQYNYDNYERFQCNWSEANCTDFCAEYPPRLIQL